ncbi:MAG: GH39 family glycosyl hydrolase, partial [Paludibacter sp.]
MTVKRIYRFIICLFLIVSSNNVVVGSKRIIQADFSLEKGSLSEMYSFCVGAGRANEGLRADWQEQLLQAKKDCGFKYIRFHGLLSDDMRVCLEENGKIVYNFQYIDKLFDFLVKIKVRPFVEFGFMPQLLSSGSQTIFWWKGNVTPPASYEEYGKLIYALTSHWKERYGEAEILKWFFEVWNEPDLGGFFTGTKEEYFLMYKTVATNVKKVHGNLKVGGPAVATPAWIPDFLKYCSDNK